MADGVTTFERLEAWKAARKLVRDAYSLFREGLASRDFGLRDQVQRAAVSAMTNIAEGFERAHAAEKLQFYNVARASCGEFRSLCYVLLDVGYIDDRRQTELLTQVALTGRLLTGLIRSTRSRASS